jgi:chemotaxis response regulator CheB
MTRVVLVADSGQVLARLTSAVGTVPGAYIIRHSSSARPLDRLLTALAPDLVVVGDLLEPMNAPARLAEVARAAPAAQVVVAPADLEPQALGELLRRTMAAHTVRLRPADGLESHVATGAAA